MAGSERLAIDIALLPPPEIAELAIEFNKQVVFDGSQPIQLHPKHCLPHISLSMGAVEQEKMPILFDEIAAICKTHPPLQLQVVCCKSKPTHAGHEVSELVIRKTSKLLALHNAVMSTSQALMSFDANVQDLFEPETVDKTSLFWINNYPVHSAFNHFSPHITLGMGTLPEEKLNIAFIADQIAVCHLGNFCTCRKVLYEKRLL